MEKEYDFTNAEQGKFYIPIEEIEAEKEKNLKLYKDWDICKLEIAVRRED